MRLTSICTSSSSSSSSFPVIPQGVNKTSPSDPISGHPLNFAPSAHPKYLHKPAVMSSVSAFHHYCEQRRKKRSKFWHNYSPINGHRFTPNSNLKLISELVPLPFNFVLFNKIRLRSKSICGPFVTNRLTQPPHQINLMNPNFKPLSRLASA